MENPTTFRVPSGNGTEEHIVHVVEYYSMEGVINAKYDEIMFCVDPIRNIDVDYSINGIKSGNTLIKKTYNSDVVIVKIGNEYKIQKSRFYNGTVSGRSLSATPSTEQTTPPKQKKKPNKKIAPPIGTIYN